MYRWSYIFSPGPRVYESLLTMLQRVAEMNGGMAVIDRGSFITVDTVKMIPYTYLSLLAASDYTVEAIVRR